MENVCAACREEKSVRGFSFLIVIFYTFQYNETMTKNGRYTYAIQTIRETYPDDPAGGDFIYYELGDEQRAGDGAGSGRKGLCERCCVCIF